MHLKMTCNCLKRENRKEFSRKIKYKKNSRKKSSGLGIEKKLRKALRKNSIGKYFSFLPQLSDLI